MISNTKDWTSPAREISAVVDVYGTSTTSRFRNSDYIKELKIDRVGENGKFFGFGVSQKLTLQLLDKNRELDITTDNSFKVSINGVCSSPKFFTTDVKRDENTNGLTITAYDALYKASEITVNELELADGYNIRDLTYIIARKLGIYPVPPMPKTEALELINEINLDGTETLREVLDDIAEALQSIYYVDYLNRLCFKRLDKDIGNYNYVVNKSNYFTFDVKQSRKLTSIVSTTDLGENVSATTGEDGDTQYVRNNVFLDLNENVNTFLEAAVVNIGGLILTPYNCTWRGNYAIEPGDMIRIIAKDDSYVFTYAINDTFTYNGGFKQVSSWSYEDKNETEHTNPSNLGEALKQTFARVDKQKQEIDIVAGEVSSIKVTTDSVTTSVQKIDNNINELTTEVNSKLSADDLTITVEKALANGANKVVTTTGFTFDENGLEISKSGSELTTNITENGLTINKGSSEVLTVNNLGVNAEDLHATTYLIIGNTSRFEDYNHSRTGCFFIGY